MKQKKINDILYVFQATPYVITEDTDAQIIKVQEESYPGFVELNPTLEDKMVKYNYKVICVNKQEWMPYINEPDQTPQKLYVINVDEDYGFYGTYTLIVNDGAPAVGTFETSVTSGDTIKLYFGNITKAQFEEQVVITKCELNHGASTFEPTLKSDDEHYYYEFTMPAGTLGFFFRINWYNFEVYGQNLEGKVSNFIDGTEIEGNTASGLHKGQTVKIVPVDDPSYYTLVSGGVSWNSEQSAWTGTIGLNNLTVQINYLDPATLHTLSFTGDCGSTYLDTVKFNYIEDKGLESSYTGVAANTSISIYPENDHPAGSPNWTITRSDGGAVNYDPSISSSIYFLNMPDSDLTINFAWTEPQENNEQPE